MHVRGVLSSMQMDGDVEVDIDPVDAENDAIAVENGSILGGSLSGNQLDFSISSCNSLPRSRDPSFEADVRVTPPPAADRSRYSCIYGIIYTRRFR